MTTMTIAETKMVRVLDGSHREMVTALRISEYQRARGLQVAPAGISWNRSDDESIVLGAFDGNKLVSTMRMEIIEDQTLLEKKLECPWNFEVPLRLPVMILSKASTHSDYRNLGLNALLRKRCLELAKEWKVHLVVGTFIKDSPRANSMKTMGYRFLENKLGWTSPHYRSLEPVVVAALDVAKDIDRAIEVTQLLIDVNLQNYQWGGTDPEFKIVRTIS